VFARIPIIPTSVPPRIHQALPHRHSYGALEVIPAGRDARRDGGVAPGGAKINSAVDAMFAIALAFISPSVVVVVVIVRILPATGNRPPRIPATDLRLRTGIEVFM
jgi:hypothetical protein